MHLYSLRVFALAMFALGLSVPTSAQSERCGPGPVLPPGLDYAPSGSDFSEAGRVLVDSLFHDTGDGDYSYTVGNGFPDDPTGCGPDELCRASRFVADITYTVPPDRSGPFSLTHVRARYRTSTHSYSLGFLYDADAPPLLQIFRGVAPPEVQNDSTLALGAVFNGEIPYTDATIFGCPYPIPVATFVLIPIATVPVGADLTFQPGERFTLRIQYFNVPFPQGMEAGYTNAFDGTSIMRLTNIEEFSGQPFDGLRFNGLGEPDTPGADGIDDTWLIRPLMDAAFVSADGAPGAAEVVLGTPSPNPAAGEVSVPFSLRAGGAVRLALYDVTGRRVTVVAERAFAAGSHVADLDTSRLAAGVYALVLEAGGARTTRQLSVARYPV